MTQPPFTIIHRPGPRQAHNLDLTIGMLAHLAQGSHMACRRRAITQQAPRPSIDSRLSGLVPGLLEKGNQRGTAGASQLLVRPGGSTGRIRKVQRLGRRRGAGRQAAGMRAGLARLDDDVPRDHLDVFVAQGAQHGEAGVVGDAEAAVGPVGRDVGADVGYVADGFEEASVRAGHVGPHVLDEVVVRAAGLGGAFGDAGGPVGHAEDDVEELDEGALRVAAAAVLSVGLSAGAIFVDNAVGEAGVGHVFAAGEEGPDAVVEDVRVAILVHAG